MLPLMKLLGEKTNMPVISTKCPTLNENLWRRTRSTGVPDLEVIVRYIPSDMGNEKINGAICPEYDPATDSCRIKVKNIKHIKENNPGEEYDDNVACDYMAGFHDINDIKEPSTQ